MNKMTGIDISALPQSHRDKEATKGKRLIEARVLWDSGDVDTAQPVYAEVATLEEELMEECLYFGVAQKYFVHAFSAAHCWIKSGNLYRAHQICQEILTHSEISPALREKGQELTQRVRDGLQVYRQSVLPRIAA